MSRSGNRPFLAYLDHCDCLLIRGVSRRILAVMPRYLRARVSPISRDWTLAVALNDRLQVCLLVDADALDPDARANVATARALANGMSEAYVLGITEFMPGTYRSILRSAGADDCFTTDHVLSALRPETQE